MKPVTIEEERCTLCGLCLQVCVRQVLQEREGRIECVEPLRCLACGHCKAVCPEDAVQLRYCRPEEFIPVPPRSSYPDPDTLLSFFRARRSVRSYRPDPVEREKLERIIQAGRFAPTGSNRQHLEYVVLQSPERLAVVRGENG